MKEPLCVVGIGCRFPANSNSPKEYWDALLRKANGIITVPKDRWRAEVYTDHNINKYGKIVCDGGGFIQGIDLFDAGFFNCSPAQANRMDPQERFLLETTFEAIEDANIRLEDLGGTNTSVFIGSFAYDYLGMQMDSQAHDSISSHVTMGTHISSLANRISYFYNLKGPSVTLNTACSSSLVAIHHACQSIWNDESEVAIAGGINLILRPETSIALSKAGFLSKDGYCKSFDNAANGYVRGEGAGIIILKRLSTALRDNNRIYALIQGSAVNQDGYVQEGFTVPNKEAQVALLKTVYRLYDIDPAKVHYIEAHGTGTPVGDTIEMAALLEVFGLNRKEISYIGSVKSNIGHLEGAAGVAGLIKAVLVLKYRRIPANLHFEQLNQGINLGDVFKIPTNVINLEDSDELISAVNSFGAGGTNAHIILRAFASQNPLLLPQEHPEFEQTTLFIFSAKSEKALRSMAQKYINFLAISDDSIYDIGYSLLACRSSFQNNLIITAASKSELIRLLQGYLEGKAQQQVLYYKVTKSVPGKLAFVFSGLGGHWYGMGQQLLNEPIFKDMFLKMDQYFKEISGWSLIEELQKDEKNSRINDVEIIHPLTMAIQIALATLWGSYGIKPDGVIGHSAGEVAAAYIAGIIDLEQVVRIAYHRGAVLQRCSGLGRMLAVKLTKDEAHRLVDKYLGAVSIATINAPNLLTLSGDETILKEIGEALEREGIFQRFVNINVPYHSNYMKTIWDELFNQLSFVQPGSSRLPIYSTVTTKRESGEHFTAQYICDNTYKPVEFLDTIRQMLRDGFTRFIEIGPHSLLASNIKEIFEEQSIQGFSGHSTLRNRPEKDQLMLSVGRYFVDVGKEGVNLHSFFGLARPVELPNYPWQHQHYWHESSEAKEIRLGRYTHPFLKTGNSLLSVANHWIWEVNIGLGHAPYLVDHVIQNTIIFPATGHIELAYAIAKQVFPHITDLYIENFLFESALILPQENDTNFRARLEIISNESDFYIYTKMDDKEQKVSWTRNSSGRINSLGDTVKSLPIRLDEVSKGFTKQHSIDVDRFYDALNYVGLMYGTQFRCIQEAWHHDNKILARVSLSVDIAYEATHYYLHPALLDAALHAVYIDLTRNGDLAVYLPHTLEKLTVYGEGGYELWSYIEVTRNTMEFLNYNIYVFNGQCELTAEFKNMSLRRLSFDPQMIDDEFCRDSYIYQWVEQKNNAVSFTQYDIKSCILLTEQESETVCFTETLKQILNNEFVNIAQETMAYSNQGAIKKLLSKSLLDKRTHILYVPALSQLPNDTLEYYNIILSKATLFLELIQSIVTLKGTPRIYLIVRNTSTAHTGEIPAAMKLDHSLLVGMTRVVRNEYPAIPIKVIDISAPEINIDTSSAILVIRDEMFKWNTEHVESEIMYCNGQRYLRKLVALHKVKEYIQTASSILPGVGGYYVASIHDQDGTKDIKFRKRYLRAPKDNEVEIAVHAAGVNFKDALNVIGILSGKSVHGVGITDDNLGTEICGTVKQLGNKVKKLKVGDAVMAWVTYGFSGVVTVPYIHCVKKPMGLTYAQAAAIPVAYITAYYSLKHLAQITVEDTVLIHSAAGGIGIASINLAKLFGAKIIATAGSEEKRDYLKQIFKLEHVFDSRSLDFYNQVMNVTHHKGVDIVLNSFPGLAMTQSIKCLAPYGRFIELGKTDIYQNKPLNLQCLAQNISYFIVDIDRLAQQKPLLHRQIFKKVVSLFAENKLIAPEINEYPITNLTQVLQKIMSSTSIGKFVVNMEGQNVRVLPAMECLLDPDKSYLITGGASGLGLIVARWMTSKGARNLILISRSGPKTEYDEEIIADMRQKGINVYIENLDLLDRGALKSLFDQFGRNMPPLAGIIHSAGLIDNVALINLTQERFKCVIEPKALGALNVHSASLKHQLDFFVLFSSISSIIGHRGQVNYAAANCFLDNLAEYRQQLGLPATSINLGVLGEYAGMSRKERDKMGIVQMVGNQGFPLMAMYSVLLQLDRVLLQQPYQRVAARIKWDLVSKAYPNLIDDTRFADVISSAQVSNQSQHKRLRDKLLDCNPVVRKQQLEGNIVSIIARILELSVEAVDVKISIGHMGMDSISLNQLRARIVGELNIDYPMMKLLRGPSVRSIVEDLSKELEATDCQSNLVAPDFSTADRTKWQQLFSEYTFLNDWLLRGKSSADNPYRLICFHSMGVGASLFTKFLDNPPAMIDILAVQLPGRENRINEPLITNLNFIADRIADSIHYYLDKPCIFWGHSFGGIVAYEVIRYLYDKYNISPAHYMVSCTLAPQYIQIWQTRDIMRHRSNVIDTNMEYLLSRMRYIEDPQFVKSIFPLINKEVPLITDYRMEPFPLPCSMTAIAARQDEVVYPDEVYAWHGLQRGSFTWIEVDGDHWPISKNYTRFVEIFSQIREIIDSEIILEKFSIKPDDR